ncbi:MAG: hypothetical protein HY737_08095 [Candidatus Omnitrophica bacterium]|nr:hypothetical protein [Candidatus Omnitrophota bacterium]
MMVAPRAIPWGPVLGAVGATALTAIVVAWYGNVTMLDQQAVQTRAGLKKLLLSGIPPTQAVVDYLTERQKTLEAAYHRWLDVATAPSVADAASADLQLSFQEQLHDAQRMLERVAAARAMAVPEQLGFPKDMPPADTVPRLLVQLALMKETTAILFEQGLISITAFKLEDPEPVAEAKDQRPFLTRVPLRVRLVASLPQLMRILAALQRSGHLIDVRAMRLIGADSPDRLDVELVLARYLLVPGAEVMSGPEEQPPTERPRRKPNAR